MQQVHVLHAANYNRNDEAFLFPVKFNRRRLLDHGVDVRFCSRITPSLMECDVLCLSSRFFRPWWAKVEGAEILEFLQKARREGVRTLWCDVSDGTGTTHFKVLPYVDKYLKNQVLKDRSLYQKIYYGSRITTDFYHRHFGVQDTDPGEPHLNHIPDSEDLEKLGVGWHFGMTHHGRHGSLWARLRHEIGVVPYFYPSRWRTPSVNRPLRCSCRIGDSYSRETIAFARKEIRKRLRERLPVNRVSKGQYYRELTQSIAAISPFGFGEVCYRDFEIIISGAAMVKQQMNHLETWPNLWIENESYLPLAWNFSDFEEKIEFIFQRPQEMVEYANQAQIRYRNLLCTEKGHREFCERFVKTLNGSSPKES